MAVHEPPVIKRLRGTLEQLSQFAKASDKGRIAHMATVMAVVTDEMMDELSENMDEITLMAYLAQMGDVFRWIGTGDLTVLPESIKPFACQIMGIEYVAPEPEPENGHALMSG